MSKPVLSAKRRQKGFESVRKGYRSANARPLIFEKEILYCKLTAASDIRKGLLHVSLGAVGSWSFCALKQGLINLGKFQKDLICFVRGCCLCVLIRALRNLEAPCKGDVFRAFRLYEKNGEYPRGLRTSGLRGRFKALSEKILAELSDGTCRTRLFAQNGGEKALNRCDIPALQRKDLERTLKGQRCSLADSRLWLGRNGRCLWWKRVALDSDKKRFWKKKGFWLAEISSFQVQLEKFSAKGNSFDRRKRPIFQLMQSLPIKKSFFSAQQSSSFPPRPN